MPSNPQAVVDRAASIRRAADAARAAGAPAAEPAPAPAAPQQAVAVPTPTPESPQPPPVVTPDAPPAEPPKPEEPPAPVNGPPEKTWTALHSAETRFAEERAAFSKEKDALQKAAQAMEKAKTDPLGALEALGWDPEKLAGVLVQHYETTGERPRGQPAAPQPAPQPQGQSDTEKRLAQMEAYVIKRDWNDVARQDETLKFISSIPGGVDYALERVATHLLNTGQYLTPQEGLAMAQGELIEREKERIKLLQSDPNTASALGLGSPAAAVQQPPPEAPVAGAEEPPLTTISSATAATAPQLPIPVAFQSDDERRQRAVAAIKAAAKM